MGDKNSGCQPRQVEGRYGRARAGAHAHAALLYGTGAHGGQTLEALVFTPLLPSCHAMNRCVTPK